MKNSAKDYITQTDFVGRIWMFFGVLILLTVPAAICLYYDAWPEASKVFQGLLGVAPIFWTVGVIEVLTYVPMLGTGGSYLGFMTGNITNLKAPAALNAMQAMDVKAGSEEAEVVSTIAIAVSSIVTTLIIALGVFALSFLTPILNSPVLKPAFDNIMPALFGGLAVVFISKNWKIAMAPLILMIVLFLAVPQLASSVGILVPLGALVAIAVARLLYKKNLV